MKATQLNVVPRSIPITVPTFSSASAFAKNEGKMQRAVKNAHAHRNTFTILNCFIGVRTQQGECQAKGKPGSGEIYTWKLTRRKKVFEIAGLGPVVKINIYLNNYRLNK